jgi:hypothetical protein
MLSKLLKMSLASKGKIGSKSNQRENVTPTDIESELESWLYNRESRYTKQVNEPLNESIINNLSGRDGWDDWDDNKAHTEGAI